MGIDKYTDLGFRKPLFAGQRDLYEEDSGWGKMERLDRPRLEVTIQTLIEVF